MIFGIRFNAHWVERQAPRGGVLVYNTARPKGPGPTKSGYTEMCTTTSTSFLISLWCDCDVTVVLLKMYGNFESLLALCCDCAVTVL